MLKKEELKLKQELFQLDKWLKDMIKEYSGEKMDKDIPDEKYIFKYHIIY